MPRRARWLPQIANSSRSSSAPLTLSKHVKERERLDRLKARARHARSLPRICSCLFASMVHVNFIITETRVPL